MEYVQEAEVSLAAREEELEARIREVQRREATIAKKHAQLLALNKEISEKKASCQRAVEELEARYWCSAPPVVTLHERWCCVPALISVLTNDGDQWWHD